MKRSIIIHATDVETSDQILSDYAEGKKTLIINGNIYRSLRNKKFLFSELSEDHNLIIFKDVPKSILRNLTYFCYHRQICIMKKGVSGFKLIEKPAVIIVCNQNASGLKLIININECCSFSARFNIIRFDFLQQYLDNKTTVLQQMQDWLTPEI